MLTFPSVSCPQFYTSPLGEPENTIRSEIMRDILHKTLRIARLNNNVLIIGENGLKKKRLARIIHKNSNLADGPFHTFYCIDINEEQYKEAFREHLQFREGHMYLKYDVIEKASGGILYLDQFSELEPRFMYNIINSFLKSSEQLFRYSMASKPRLILSMNPGPYKKISRRRLWKTITHLIDPVVIMLPPLRERKEDIPVIIEYYLKQIKADHPEWNNLSISSGALFECLNYNWPGNVRQLKNAIFQGAILSHGQTIEPHHLPFSMSWKKVPNT